jgi:prepilin-type N-terminal cleavage/methylation domain-containing protein
MRKILNNKKNNKGFTLVELIVVLVILAILAAILVPALLGYIDKAKEKQIVLNAKSCLTAAQAKYSELYARDATELTDTDKDDILDMADVDTLKTLTIGTKKDFEAGVHEAYTVTYIEYVDEDGTIWFDGSSWVNEDPEADLDNVVTISKSSK